MAAESAATQVATGVIAQRLEAARRDLLDLGLRNNSLLNYRPSRRFGVEVTNALPSEVFRILVLEGKRMSFLPGGTDPSDQLAQPEDRGGDRPAARHTDLRLQTALISSHLQKRLLATYYAARTFIEEQGANILYLALGMLTWFEADSSQEPRRAPLLLIPVELERSSAAERFFLRHTGDEVGDNLSLREKLRVEFGVHLPDLPDVDELDVEGYFGDVRRAVAAQRRWSIDARAVALGFFSFGKFLMYRDLDSTVWPEEAQPSQNPILHALLGNGFSEPPSAANEETFLDSLPQARMLQSVVDTDGSQALAILDVNAGRNLVIQGPPGTGKSQTITNIIAEALHMGKTVLFVAEKMAALEVVKRRLDQVGLGDACLELHSYKTQKKSVLRELQRTLDLGRPSIDRDTSTIMLLEESRARLNAYCAAVNTPVGQSGVTPYRAYGELLRLQQATPSRDWPQVGIPELATWSASEFAEREQLVDELEAHLGRMGMPVDHPFWGVRRQTPLVAEQESLIHTLANARQALDMVRDKAFHIAQILGLRNPETLGDVEYLRTAAMRVGDAPSAPGVAFASPDWLAKRDELAELLAAGVRFAAIHERLEDIVVPEAWQRDLLPLRQQYAAYRFKLWRFLSDNYRAAKSSLAELCTSELPRRYGAQLQLVDDIMEAQRHQQTIAKREDLGAELFGPYWQAERSDWEQLAVWSEWIIALHTDLAQGLLPKELPSALERLQHPADLHAECQALDTALSIYRTRLADLVSLLEFDARRRFHSNAGLDEQPLSDLAAMLKIWAERLDDLSQMITFNIYASRCLERQLGPIADIAERWPDAPNRLGAAFRRSRLLALLDRAMKENQQLATFDGSGHESLAARFRELDKQLLRVNRIQVAHRHWTQVPRHDGGGQLALLRREFGKRRRHLPIRQLMARAGSAIQAIKPVFMMSPLSIAMYLPPGRVTFDLVVFDEASQVKPVDAFGALLRARQAVVVGDSKQLPPTSFFDVLIENENVNEDMMTGDVESILDLFVAQNAPQRMLRWHYRSRHESLIALSNQEFYGNRLVVFPSPDATRHNTGLRYHYLPDTSYDRGGSRQNLGEAKAVAQAVMEHARTQPNLTLGVAAFSAAQAEAILDQLEILRRQDSSCETFFTGHPHEPFFVKNLENVQGDERDVVFISIGYGRAKDGYVAMNFGPLNNLGGERRLNVLITRARVRCEVFTNITADDIDLSRSNAVGVAALKRFLRYAQTNELDVPHQSGREAESPFEDAVYEALTGAGYQVHRQVGSGGFFIDLAVVDPRRPGRYLLGIECDGATYHSARWARDRDRLRQQVLEGLGWRIHRIWSTDWFRNPSRELDRVVAAISVAVAGTPPTADSPQGPEETVIVRTSGINEAIASSKPAPYSVARPRVMLYGRELHRVPPADFAKWIVEVVRIESPVHRKEAMRRIVDAAGVGRAGGRIQEAFDRAVRIALRSGEIRDRNGFLWIRGMETPPIRDRSAMNGAKSIQLIAPEEIAEAVLKVVSKSFGMDQDEAIQAACRLLGFQRVTDNMTNHVQPIVADMVARQRLRRRGNQLTLG